MSPVAVHGTPHRPMPSKDNGGLGPNPRLRELAFPQLPSEHFSDERLRKTVGNPKALGTLEAAKPPLQNATISPSVACAPPFRTTKALTDSPRYASGTPIAAASATAGCMNKTSSTSRGYTL